MCSVCLKCVHDANDTICSSLTTKLKPCGGKKIRIIKTRFVSEKGLPGLKRILSKRKLSSIIWICRDLVIHCTGLLIYLLF